jgi:hypothetical protein
LFLVISCFGESGCSRYAAKHDGKAETVYNRPEARIEGTYESGPDGVWKKKKNKENKDNEEDKGSAG